MELDIGCGQSKAPGTVGLDMIAFPCVDVIFEMQRGVPLPFGDNIFSAIHMYDVIEHVDSIAWTLAEVHRVAKPNSPVCMRYPHFSNPDTFNDVTHIHALGLHAFDHFDPSTSRGNQYQYYKMFGRDFPFKIEYCTPQFSRKVGAIGRPLIRLIGQDKYERRFSRFLPVQTVNLKMRVLKNI